MKFVKILITIHIAALFCALFSLTTITLLPTGHGIDSLRKTGTEELLVNEGFQTTLKDTNNTFALKLLRFIDADQEGLGNRYSSIGLQDQNAVYLQSGTDFPTALHYFYVNVIKGSALIYPTLSRTFNLPNEYFPLILVMMGFLYLAAIIEFISTRNILQSTS